MDDSFSYQITNLVFNQLAVVKLSKHQVNPITDSDGVINLMGFEILRFFRERKKQ